MQKIERTVKNVHPDDRYHFIERMALDGWKLSGERRLRGLIVMAFERPE